MEIYKSMEQSKTKRLILSFQYFDMFHFQFYLLDKTCFEIEKDTLLYYYNIIITNESNTV